ncbi:hypothetical protein EHP00_2031 [Ecytonucleospora hepatopenaei]|uniref:Uncharacterized protein n=1 Tax=Ecytonucleospora hepatopenaei TaxID=646526 RepID=A0A1W0E423_9MICR|nr:hypothetical protein EHP00_2031 [Ecytonucleospora hepatopenaei]
MFMQTNKKTHEHTVAIQRNHGRNNEKYNLVEKLAILLKTHKESKYLCTATSVAYRVAALCDLALGGHLMLSNNVVKSVKTHSNDIYNDMLIKISQINGSPSDVIKNLNGEKKKENAVKNLKKKIYTDIERKALVKRHKGIVSNKITLKDTNTWKEIFDQVVAECCSTPTMHTKVLLICLEYINGMQDVLIQLPGEKAEAVSSCMMEVREKLVKKERPSENVLIYLFLEYLCKKRIFI